MLRFASPLVVFGLVVAAIALEPRPAAACQADYPCSLRRPRTEPAAYMRAIRGSVPAWSHARITKFLTDSVWRPVASPKRTPARHLDAGPFVFVEAERMDDLEYDGRIVILGRVVKQESSILVEIEGVTWKLGACTHKKGHACLVQARTLEIVDID